jgi:ABC-type dipeptide/oligopeptide/nickel transport system permease subunit
VSGGVVVEEASAVEWGRGGGLWRQAFARFRRRPLGILALLVLLFFVVVALLAPTIAPYSGAEIFMRYLLDPQPPSLHDGHLLGTDLFGHDYLTQMLWAIRESVLAGLGCAAVATAIGLVVGAAAGYLGGVVDALATWLTSLFFAVPALVVLAIVVVYKSPLPLWAFPATLAGYLWIYVARVVRASFVTLEEREFVEAAHAAGASGLWIVVRHLLPNSVGTLLAAGTAIVGQSTVIIATVTFFGWGNQQSDRPTFGLLLSYAANGTQFSSSPFPALPWWLWVLPAITLGLFIISVYFLADTLDELLQPGRA